MRKLCLTLALTAAMPWGMGVAVQAQEAVQAASDSGSSTAPIAADSAPIAAPAVISTPPQDLAPAPSTADSTAPEVGLSSASEPLDLAGAPAVVAPVAAPANTSGHASAHTDLLEIVLAAHWVVLAVMIGLAVAAFATLVIFIQKLLEFALAFRSMGKVAKLLSQSQNLTDARALIADRKGPAAEMVKAAAEEYELARLQPALLPGVRERTHASLVRIDAGAAQRLRSATGILASIGSLSPFVGLFGTVFGIMNSFLAIAETKTTNLAVVAPGIAEALLATAIGLAAAIPAVLIYNICSRRLAKYRYRLADVAAATERLQSRALDLLQAQVSQSARHGG